MYYLVCSNILQLRLDCTVIIHIECGSSTLPFCLLWDKHEWINQFFFWNIFHLFYKNKATRVRKWHQISWEPVSKLEAWIPYFHIWYSDNSHKTKTNDHFFIWIPCRFLDNWTGNHLNSGLIFTSRFGNCMAPKFWCHTVTKPFNDQSTFDHLNTGLSPVFWPPLYFLLQSRLRKNLSDELVK